MKQDIFEDDNEGIFHYKLIEQIEDGLVPDLLDLPKPKINPHVLGAKLDNEKPRLDLVLGDFAKALQEVGKIGTMGAKKYTDHGWLSVDQAETRYLSAGLRHYFQHSEGIYIDEESGLPHLAHHAWNALAVLELYLRKYKSKGKSVD
jgi:hypothetical protein